MQVHAINEEFDYLAVTRAGGITGAVERVVIDRGMVAQVHRFLGADARVKVDAASAADTIHELAEWAARHIDHPTRPRGSDIFRYAIELGWKGHVYRFHADGLAVDEALHGTVALADRLLDVEPPRTTTNPRALDGHAAGTRTRSLLPTNGNSGIVPPWLDSRSALPANG